MILKRAPQVFASEASRKTSDRYLFIPTEKIITGLTNNGWHVVSAIGQRSTKEDNRAFGKHSLMLVRNEQLEQARSMNKGDTLPMLRIDNSHNGLSSFKLTAALFRMVCANGLTVPDTMLASPSIKHTVNIDRDTIEASFKIIQDFPKLMNQIDGLKSIELNGDEKRFLAESAKNLIFESEAIARTNELADKRSRPDWSIENQLLRPVRFDDRKNDLWTTINVIQENAIRGNVQLLTEANKVRAARKVTSLDRDKTINQELMILAQKMAELKGLKLTA
jgi:hypothetical protein